MTTTSALDELVTADLDTNDYGAFVILLVGIVIGSVTALMCECCFRCAVVWLFFQQLCDDPTANTEELNIDRKLLRIIDLMGREVKDESSPFILYEYSDGSVERKVKGF